MYKVMIVDDSAFMRSVIRKIITNAGYHVVAEAENGMEAVHLYNVHSPDVVTMDLTMPGMGGLEALRVLMTLNPIAKVIVVSAMRQAEIINEAVKAGARGFLVKPFQPGAVVRELLTCLKKM
ncbi:response regulator [Alicyclobacillus dauci]|uniref:Response regulator n=1 Tax=Alicyclobacillus dauci TaxID=1475485 RepID=A0ABY6Z7V2_9BACL|nr:response regulator [Alicyclobacillus dauci]WAH38324.1 response regulator [Alicyclobacillus dauci]